MPDWLAAEHTAVITGGANGIGLAAAKRFAEAGMNVAIADLDEEALDKAEIRLNEDHRGRVLALACDVSEPDELERLRDTATDHFGHIHCLMNNAGIVRRMDKPWEGAEAQKQLIGVNYWGIVHGCCAFIPAMLDHGQPGAIINTGSKQGITRPPGNIAYNASKAGVLAYTEGVAHGLRNIEGCALGAHLLVPGFVYSAMISDFIPEKPPGAATPEETIDFMIASLERGDFYIICPDNETTREIDEKRIQWTADDIIKNRPPLSRWHPDYKEEFAAFMSDQTP